MNKKKVCILQNGLARGGTDTFVVNLCKALNKDKFEVTVVNPSNKPDSLFREVEVLATGATIIHTHPLIGIKGRALHLCRLYRLLRQVRFDVFQTNIDLFNGPNLFVAWMAGIPIRCCHSHNTRQQKNVVKGESFLITLYQKMMRWMCWHFSNRRCGCSEEAMNFLYNGYPWQQNEYPSVIYNGIELNKFRHQAFDVSFIKQQLGFLARHYILTVGNIIPQKNPFFIAQIMKEVCAVRDDVELLWVGTGNLQKDVMAMIEEFELNQKVHFLGSRNDVPTIMKCCDVFLLPSLFEGLGIVLIEAQASGLPCVVSDNVPQLANCGAVQYLSLSSSNSIWVASILDAIDGEEEIVIDNKKLQNFSIEHMAEQMELVFNS